MALTRAKLFVFIVFFGIRGVIASPLEDYLEGDTEAADRAAAIEELLTAPLDLNQVSRSELLSLPWLTRSAAIAILRERSRLGGFRDFSQIERIQELSRQEVALLQETAFVGRSPVRPFRGTARLNGSGHHGIEEPLRAANLRGESRARLSSASGVHGFVLSRHSQGSPVLSHLTSAGLGFDWPYARLLVGDYQAEFATGLVLASSYGQAGWTRDALRVTPPQARSLRSSPTASPMGYLRGAAVETQWRSLRFSSVFSSQELAAVLEDGRPIEFYRSSVSADELSAAREGQLREELVGFSLSAERSEMAVGVNGIWANYKPGLSPTSTPEIPEPLNGDQLRVGSLYLSAAHEGLAFLAELAGSSPGGTALQSAASLYAGRVAFASFVTYADADFHSPHSRAWDEFDTPAQNNRTVGTLLRIALENHLLTLRAASSATPFRTATSSLPRTSSELDARWQTFWRNITLEIRGERDHRETSVTDGPSYPVDITGGRLDITIKYALELRLRTQLRRADSPAAGHDGVGTLSFIQIGQKRPLWTWIARLTLFHVTSDEAALTVYENHLRGSYPLISYYGDGSRKMLLLTRRLGLFQIGAKVARTDRTVSDEYTWDWQFALQGEVRW